MERIAFDSMARLDEQHWWFVARRRILADVIERIVPLPASPAILEVGCGTGHNLGMLGRFGAVEAVEMDAEARRVAEARHGRPIVPASLPELRGLEGRRFDLVALLDVLEHVEDDAAALKALRAKLAPDGSLLLTVPQHPWMWSSHDVAHHHHRRYTREGLAELLEAAGFHIRLLSSMNSLLFPLAIANRAFTRLTGRERRLDAMPAAPVNGMFQAIFAAERHLLGRVPMPPGLSLVAVAS